MELGQESLSSGMSCKLLKSLCNLRFQNLKSPIPGSSPWWGSAHGAGPGVPANPGGSGWLFPCFYGYVAWKKKKIKKSSRDSQSSPSSAVPFWLQKVEWQVCSFFLVHVALALLVIHANIYPCWSPNGSVSESLNHWPFTKTGITKQSILIRS